MTNYYLDELCEITVGKYILEVTIFGRQFEEEHVDRVIKKSSEMAGDKEYLVLTDVNPKARVSFWGLRKLAGALAMKYAKAKAYVIPASNHQLLAEMFFKLYKPARPIKLFTNKELALKWLESLIDSPESGDAKN